MARKVVLVAGSPGAGKTSVLAGVTSDKYKKVGMGTLMLEEAARLGYAKDRDYLRFMDVDKLHELKLAALKRIAKMEGNIIIDTHASVEHNARYVPGITFKDIENLKDLSAIIYIDSFTEDIVARRSGDSTRKREDERLELIDIQRLINVSVLSTCASCLGIPIYVVLNMQDKLNDSINEMKSHLVSVFGE